MHIPRFLKPNDSVHTELRQRITAYFQRRGEDSRGDIRLHSKAIILVAAFLAIYVHLVFFLPEPAWVCILEAVLLGGLTAAIGFNVMHDGAHGSFSKYPFVNELAGLSLNFLGANVFMWKTKHNVVHHTFTNIDGVDDDLNARPLLRLSPGQRRYWIHRYQYLYFWMVYSLLYVYWVFFTDYKKYFLQRVGEMPITKMKWSDHVSFWGFKVLHLGLFVALPIYTMGFTTWLIGFLVYAFTAGLILSVVFQMAHAVSDTAVSTLHPDHRIVEAEWAVHQLNTTANFATRNKVLSWLVGGLNYQIEHHLFPHISHVHYPAISKIVREVCEERGIRYIEYPRFRHALVSHIQYLRELGRA